MQGSDELLLQLEVQAAAARNADLSRQLERLTEELSYSTVHCAGKVESTSRGTQTENQSTRDVALDLDDLLFEIAETMFRLYPSTPIDLSSRRGNTMKSLKQLSHTCLSEMQALRAAWETKDEGYTKFIDELQKALGEHYRSVDTMESRLRKQESDCAVHLNENKTLATQCLNLGKRLKAAEDLVQTITEDKAYLTKQVTDLDNERQDLLNKEKTLTQTVASLRAVIDSGPLPKAPSSLNLVDTPCLHKTAQTFTKDVLDVVQTPSMNPRVSASPFVQTPHADSAYSASTRDVLWACQGSSLHKGFPEFCVPTDKCVDFCCKARSH